MSKYSTKLKIEIESKYLSNFDSIGSLSKEYDIDESIALGITG